MNEIVQIYDILQQFGSKVFSKIVMPIYIFIYIAKNTNVIINKVYYTQQNNYSNNKYDALSIIILKLSSVCICLVICVL